MKRIVVLLVVVITGAIGRTAPVDTTPAALADFFKPGVVLQDRNGDGVIDFVDARIVLGEQPSPGELAAASDVAARLGFETSAMTLPLRRSEAARSTRAGGEPWTGEGGSIFVGAKSLAGSGATPDAIGGAGLRPGDGAVVAFTRSGHSAIALLGDDSGIAAAS